MATEKEHNEFDEWYENNKTSFVPPICNKLMHQQSHLKVMYVGGPNVRKDYHLEEGEEFFYMIKGDMCLKVMEHGKFKDIDIKEGEVFLLPGRTLHSPNRTADSMGLVIERERQKHEIDCVRYFVEDSTETLYEKWFFCDDLGKNLGPLVKAYFASEQYKTGKPIPGTITENPSFVADQSLTMIEPFHLATWITANRTEIDQPNGKILFPQDGFKSEIRVLGNGKHSQSNEVSDIYLFVLKGQGTVKVGTDAFSMKKGSSHLVRKGQKYILEMDKGSSTVSTIMDPR